MEHRISASLSLFCAYQAISRYILQQMINYTILLFINSRSCASPNRRLQHKVSCSALAARPCVNALGVSVVNSYRACPLRLPHCSTFSVWRTNVWRERSTTDSMSNVREKRGARGHHSVSENLCVEEKVHYVAEKSFDTQYFSSLE